MAITAAWQGNLRTLTFGSGTAYRVLDQGLRGLGSGSIDGYRQNRSTIDGLVGGNDRLRTRQIAIPFAIRQASAATASAKMTDILNAWRPASSDLELQMRIPGTPATIMSYWGRPDGVDAKVDLIELGYVEMLAQFECLDPLRYGAEETDNNNSGTFTVTNSGNAPSDRVTITITADGVGAPSLVNTTDSSKTITWNTTLAASTVRVIDLRDRTVETAGGANKYSEIDPSSAFFQLLSGGNSWTATNISDVDITFRSAWY